MRLNSHSNMKSVKPARYLKQWQEGVLTPLEIISINIRLLDAVAKKHTSHNLPHIVDHALVIFICAMREIHAHFEMTSTRDLGNILSTLV